MWTFDKAYLNSFLINKYLSSIISVESRKQFWKGWGHKLVDSTTEQGEAEGEEPRDVRHLAGTGAQGRMSRRGKVPAGILRGSRNTHSGQVLQADELTCAKASWVWDRRPACKFRGWRRAGDPLAKNLSSVSPHPRVGSSQLPGTLGPGDPMTSFELRGQVHSCAQTHPETHIINK